MRLSWSPPSPSAPDLASGPEAGLIEQWTERFFFSQQITQRAFSTSSSVILFSSRSFAAFSSTKAVEYAFKEIWMTLMVTILLAFLVRQLLLAYRMERAWQSLLSHIRTAIANKSFDTLFIKDGILSFFSSSASSSRVTMRYTAELFATLERRPDIYPPQALRALASELAALGVAVDVIALHIAIKRQRNRRLRCIVDPCSDGHSRGKKYFKRLSEFYSLLSCSFFDAVDTIFNDPASSLVALCM